MGHSESNSKREIYSITGIFQKKKQEKAKINNLTLYLKELEKEKQIKPTVSRRKEIIKIWAEINEIESKKPITKINGSKSWFFEKINKIDKTLTRLIRKIERTQINKIINERGERSNEAKEYKEF